MERNRFAEIMKIAADYYSKELEPDVMRIYFEELGGMTERALEEAVRRHIRSAASFPKISHLKPVAQSSGKKPRRYDEHPQFKRHCIAAERMLDQRHGQPVIEEPGTYLFNFEELVDRAVAVGRKVERYYTDDALHLRNVRSVERSTLYRLVIAKFEELVSREGAA